MSYWHTVSNTSILYLYKQPMIKNTLTKRNTRWWTTQIQLHKMIWRFLIILCHFSMMLKVNRHLIKKLDLNLLLHQTSTTNLLHSCYQSEYACLGNWNGRYVSGWKKWQPFHRWSCGIRKNKMNSIFMKFAGVSGNEFVFMALDSKVENIKTTQWQAYHWLEQ